MSRPAKVIRNIFLAAGALTLVLLAAAILVVRTSWFQNYVKQSIVATLQDRTGGRAEVGSFQFEWTHLRAVATDLVLHGKERSSDAPLLRVARIRADFSLFTGGHLWRITNLDVTQPQANVVVFPNGSTNLPTPRKKFSANQTPLETVVNLAIGHFEIANGLITLAAQNYQLNARGNNLRVQLAYSTLKQDYTGQLSLQPLYVVAGRNTPVDFTVQLPLLLGRNKIEAQGIRIASHRSALVINAAVNDLQNPRLSAQVNGHVALADLKDAGNLPLKLNDPHLPSTIDVNANATAAGGNIQIANLRLALGKSNIEASGALDHGLDFKSVLSLNELARLTNTSSVPAGLVNVNGTATLAQNNLNLTHLQVGAFGAQFSGDAMLQDFARFQIHGDLRNLDLRNATLAAGQSPLPYDGVISGPLNAMGSLTSPVLRQFTANAQLTIAPGSHGIPVSGRLTAAYSGANDNVQIEHSLLTLPHTRLTLNGSPGKQLDVALTTTNLNDLLAAVPESSRPAMVLDGGQVSFTGTVTGHLTAPDVAGHLSANRFQVAGRRFDSLVADASASENGAALQNATLSRNSMQARFAGSVGLRDWKPLPSEPVAVTSTIQNGDLADLLALAGQPSAGYSGQLTANINISGTVGNPRGSGTVTATNGTIDGQPFDRAQAQINLTDQLITIPGASMQAGAAHVNLTATYQHPRDSLTTGQLRASIQSTQLDLSQIQALQKDWPQTSGTAQLNATLAANILPSGNPAGRFQLSSVNGNASVRSLRSEGQTYGDLTAIANTTGQTINYNLTSNFAGSNIQLVGDTQLKPGYPILDNPSTVHATVANLPIAPVLALAHRADIPIAGVASGTANFSGTLAKPEGSADLSLAKATVYNQPLDRVRAALNYSPDSIDLTQLEAVSGPSRIDLSAQYTHPEGTLETGNLKFQIAPTTLDLARLKGLTARYPGLAGNLQIDANGSAEIRPSAPNIQIRDIDASVKASGLAVQGKNLGDVTLTGKSSAGRVNVALDSNLAGAAIQARGAVELAAGYPTNAQLMFQNLTWAGVQPLLGAGSLTPENFEAVADGQASVNGPLTDIQRLRGSFQLTRLNLSSKSSLFGAPTGASTALLENQGPISATLDRGGLQIQSAHLAGPQTKLEATGTVPLNGQSMNVALKGNLNLAVLQKFNRSITSSGQIVLDASVRGTFTQPELGGQIELRDSSFDYAGFPTGFWKAKGFVLLSGDSAVLRDVSAEAGGGRMTLTGSASMSGVLRFAVQARASRVRLQLQPGLAVQVSANVNASGTTSNSTISGTVTLDQVSYATRTDLGSLLSIAAPPVQAVAPSPLLDNMRLDLRVRSSSALAVQASLAQNVQLNADLRIRGTAAHPGVLGRMDITEGKLVFFGSTYTVNNGSISFFNPIRIDPILDLSLETQAQGVDVVLKVTGPVDNMKVSYTSDPPLQFQEIVALLATGTTPTSDPTLLANQPSVSPQNFQQMGESAIVGQAVANPVSNQLQRVFGVTQLKINPTFTGNSTLPETQLALTQQVSSNLTFTYVTGLNTANAETIQVQWTFTPQWSAQALRDYNGIFSVTLTYKMQLR